MSTNYNLDNFRRVINDSVDTENKKESKASKKGRPKGSKNVSTRGTIKKKCSSSQSTRKSSTKKSKVEVNSSNKSVKSDEDCEDITLEEKIALCNERYGEGNWYFLTKEEFISRFKEDQARRRFLRGELDGEDM